MYIHNDYPPVLAADDTFAKYYPPPTHTHQTLQSVPEILRRNRIVLYGYAFTGKLVCTLASINGLTDSIIAIWDKHPGYKGVRVGNVQVKPPPQTGDDLPAFDLVLVASGSFSDEITLFLQSLGIPRTKITKLDWVDTENAYFDPQIILPRLSDNEIFIDGGVYTFSTSRRLLELNPRVSKIYAFEPDLDNFERAKINASALGFNNIVWERAAWWSQKTVLQWESDGGGSNVKSTGALNVAALRIDDVIPSDENVTFIKLDVEGSEMEVMRGAERTICRCKPKLAICIYHKPNDYYEIAAYIRLLVPEYKAYIRHYSSVHSDSVLYCVL